MRDLSLDLQAAGGAASRSAMRELGHTHRQLRDAVLRGEVHAAGRSWLVRPDCDPAITVALKAGGVLGGATALGSFGVWVTRTPPVQVATKSTRGVGRLAEAERIWGSFALDALPWRVSILDALAQHTLRVDRGDAIASIDSAWHKGLVGEPEIERLFLRLPRRCASMRSLLDAKADSGLESLLRVPCQERGWQVESQPPAPGGGRSDLLLDGWLYIEADGSEWHDNEKQAAKDRRRNTAITEAGGRWLRFGSADVLHRLEHTVAVIEMVMAQGRPAVRLAS